MEPVAAAGERNMKIIIMEMIGGVRGFTIEGKIPGSKFRAVLESFKAAIPEGARSYNHQPVCYWSVSATAAPRLEEWAAEWARKGAHVERRDLTDGVPTDLSNEEQMELLTKKLLDSFGSG